MIRTQIQLTEQQAQALKSLAVERGSSVAELIRQGVDDLLQKTSGISIEERRRRAIAAIGRFHSGQKDISTRHDDYLAEAYEV
jgi:Arc/MetJ-type ribon-helix-helix transcriptional regulator